MFEQSPEESKGVSAVVIWGKAFQTERTTSVRALRQEHT
jgi:hypothetical protein